MVAGDISLSWKRKTDQMVILADLLEKNRLQLKSFGNKLNNIFGLGKTPVQANVQR